MKRLHFNHSMLLSASIPLVAVIGASGGLLLRALRRWRAHTRRRAGGAVSDGFRGIRAPAKWNMVVGVLSLVTVGLSNLSLYYLNYPTQVEELLGGAIDVTLLRRSCSSPPSSYQ